MDIDFEGSVLIAATSGKLPGIKSVATIETLSNTLGDDLRRSGVKANNLTISIPYFGSPVMNRLVGIMDHKIWKIPYMFSSNRVTKDKFDIVHLNFGGYLPGWLQNEMKKTAYVSTIYDIVDLIFSQNTVQHFDTYVRRAAEADRIIVSSQQTKKDLVNILKVPESKIDIVHVGVDNRVFVPSKMQHKDRRVVIHVGGPVKRKNKRFALDVFAEILKSLPDTIFIMVGYSDAELNHAAKLQITEKIRFVKNLTESELVSAYQEADLMIYPTTYDGYSVPVVEAMCCGVPSIVHNNSCFPEIVRDTGIIMPDYNLREWTEMCVKILTDNNLHKELSARCKQWSKEFSREKYVKEIMRVYKRAQRVIV
ncbi:MAG: glycosyltransferase family 4 protein [Thermoproteota archaeon]